MVRRIKRGAATRGAGDAQIFGRYPRVPMKGYGWFVMDIDIGLYDPTGAHIPAWIDQRDTARAVLESLGDAVITASVLGEITYMNPAAAALTGWRPERAEGESLNTVFHVIDESTRQPVPDPVLQCLRTGAFSADATRPTLRALDDSERAIHYRVTPVRARNNEYVGVAVSFADVSEVRQVARDLYFQAHHDPLTGLSNRCFFERRLSELLEERSAESTATHAVLYIDLDNFKVVNDTAGHAAGDALLRQLSEALGAKVRRGDVLARLGGDEFAAILYDCSVEEAVQRAEELVVTTRGYRFTWDERSFRVGASVGVVEVTPASIDSIAVLAAADAACYAAKDAGRNQCHVYTPADDTQAAHHDERHRSLARLKNALATQQLCLYAQPIAPLTSEHRGGLELLVRIDDDAGQMAAQSFYGAAERYRLAPHIDRWVLGAVVEAGPKIKALLDVIDFVSINVSAQSFVDRNFAAYLVDHIDQAGLPRGAVMVEITETAAVTNLNTAVEFIQLLRRAGVRVALDNFGSGFSSWAHLRDVPFDMVKIDGALTRDADTDPVALAMVRAIVDVVRVLGKTVVGERVEHEDVKAALVPAGVAYGQGYHFGVPVPLDEAVLAILD